MVQELIDDYFLEAGLENSSQKPERGGTWSLRHLSTLLASLLPSYIFVF